MATGDLTNNLRKLQKELKLIKYTETVDITGMSQGVPTTFLPIYHYLFTNYSHCIAEMISTTDIELYGKTDMRFMEAMYKILRDLFNYKPPITKEQFFNSGFAERKIIMCAEVVQKVREKNKSLQPAKKPSTSAMSTVSQLNGSTKNPRPKSADSGPRVPPTTSATKSKHASGDKSSHRPASARNSRPTSAEVSAAPQVVNELRQPRKQKQTPPRHVANHSSTEPAPAKSPPRVTKQVLQQSEIQPHQFLDRFSNKTMSTPSISHVRSNAVEVVSVPRVSGFNIGPEDIETVSAVIRGDSFLEPQQKNMEAEAQHWQEQVNSLYKTMDNLTGKIGRFESMLMNISNTVQSQLPQTDQRVIELISKIQQQVETLTARMVLVENRVAMLEAKVESGSNFQSLITSPNNQPITNASNTDSSSSCLAGHKQLTNQNAVDTKTTGRLHQGEQISSQSTLSNLNGHNIEKEAKQSEQVQSSLPDYMSSHDGSTPIGLSPIRQVPGAAAANGVPLLHDSTNEDTFAMVTDDDARMSSTPTDFDTIRRELGNDSMSFINFGDHSTQERVDRIKNLVRSTEEMLKPT